MGTTTCLIVGATPSAQFLAWRLYSSDSIIILVGPYVSSDGLIAWKSTKLGANFYTPLIFSRDVSELPEKIDSFRNKDLMTTIDVIIISAVSLPKLEETCEQLAELSSKDTTVLVTTEYGVELEEIVLKYFHDKCRCVLSVLCNMECRQLSLGSYALVNDDDCKVSIGLSYNLSSEKNKDMVINAARAEEELSDMDNSVVSQLISQLRQTLWIDVEIQYNLSVKIWELLVPKISLVIPAIIHEELDYDEMLKDEPIKTICENIIKELYEICKSQCNQQLEKFISADNNESIEFHAIVDYGRKQKLLLSKNTATEYPEYLSLPFEAYCFYHRFEYPAHILLFQPIKLAKAYGLNYSNLNFLYSIYTKLLSLCGLSILGGRVETGNLMFLDNKLKLSPNGLDCSSVAQSTKETTKKKKKKSKNKKKVRKQKVSGKEEDPNKHKINARNGIQKLGSANDDSTGILPPELESMYLDAQEYNFYSPKSPGVLLDPNCQVKAAESDTSNDIRSTAESASAESSSDDSEYESDDSEESSSLIEVGSKGEGRKTSHRNSNADLRSNTSEAISNGHKDGSHLCDKCATEISRKQRINSDEFDDLFFSEDDEDGVEEDTISMLENPLQKRSRRSSRTLNKIVGGMIPQYLKRGGAKCAGSKGLSFDRATQLDLALQVRQRNTFTSSQEYDSLEDDLECRSIRSAKKLSAYDQAKRKLWQMQRNFNIYRGTVTIPRTTPYDEMLQQIEVLNRANTGNIIDLTTTRYGETDTYYNFQQERHKLTHILKDAHFKYRTLQIQQEEDLQGKE